METPSSTRRITRSQAAAYSQKNKQEEETSHLRSRTGEARAPLLDITNDSPVVGLATGCLPAERTPSSSSAVKSRVRARRTPGSGEEVLRGQVRTLLQKVEEEAELVNKLPPFGHLPPPPLPPPFPALLGLSRPPLQLVAPTPANTPQFATPCAHSEEEGGHQKFIQVEAAFDPEEPLGPPPQECPINRALMFDSPEKSDVSSGASSLTYQCSSHGSRQEKSPEDDNSSIWSIQVNASSISDELVEDAEEEEEDINSEETEAAEEEEEETGDDDEDLLGDLCEGLEKMSMLDEEPRLPVFAGKHTRFIYNSDDEIEGEEEEVNEKGVAVSPSVLVLKGLPAPEGKHLRFHEEEEEED